MAKEDGLLGRFEELGKHGTFFCISFKTTELLLLDNAGPIVFCTDPDVVCECLDSYGPLAASLFAMYKSELFELFDLVGLLVALDT